MNMNMNMNMNMDMNMNSSLPSVSQTRLRNSCDACNTAKVKCSKEHPSCRRCERRDLFCVYSVSLRSSKQRHERPAAESRNPSSRGADTHAHAHADVDAHAHLNIGTCSDTVDATLETLSDVDFDLPELDDYFPNAASLASLANLPPLLSYASTSTSTSTSTPHQRHHAHAHSHLAAAYAHTATGTSTPPLTPAPKLPICGCQQSILSKLSELSLSSPVGDTAMPFDGALSENRAIIALCSGVLDCGVCAPANDAMLVLSLAALLTHILVVFDTLFRARREALRPQERGRSRGVGGGGGGLWDMDLLGLPHGGLSTRSASSTREGGDAASSSATATSKTQPPVRLHLGNYQLDEGDEQILLASLLKIELGKITALVEAFESRFSRPGSRAAAGVEHGMHLQAANGAAESKLHQDIVAFLQQRLRTNYEALKRIDI